MGRIITAMRSVLDRVEMARPTSAQPIPANQRTKVDFTKEASLRLSIAMPSSRNTGTAIRAERYSSRATGASSSSEEERRPRGWIMTDWISRSDVSETYRSGTDKWSARLEAGPRYNGGGHGASAPIPFGASAPAPFDI